MFKNVTIYRLPQGWSPSASEMEAALSKARHVPCGATQEKSVGWVEPRGEEHGALVESIAGQRMLKLLIETKAVPGTLVREKADAEAARIELAQGRKPGKKEMKQLREDALLALLPQAFPKKSGVWVWINLGDGLLVVDASSQSKIDEVVTALVQSFDGLVISLVQTLVTPQTAMTRWLGSDSGDEGPEEFSVLRECELCSSDEEKAAVKFTRHNLEIEEVRRHIAQGKLPTRLALSWNDRVAFTLTESMQIKGIKFLDGVFDGRSDEADAGFDADVALATGELAQLIPALVEALGGELVVGAPAGDGGDE